MPNRPLRILSGDRATGRTTELVQWVRHGKRIERYPWGEWVRAHGVDSRVEVVIDNVEHLFARIYSIPGNLVGFSIRGEDWAVGRDESLSRPENAEETVPPYVVAPPSPSSTQAAPMSARAWYLSRERNTVGARRAAWINALVAAVEQQQSVAPGTLSRAESRLDSARRRSVTHHLNRVRRRRKKR